LAADGLTILVGNSDRDRGIVVLLSAANPLSIRCQYPLPIHYLSATNIRCQFAANIRCQFIIYPLPISATNIRCQYKDTAMLCPYQSDISVNLLSERSQYFLILVQVLQRNQLSRPTNRQLSSPA
jgi:hypothetical protein